MYYSAHMNTRTPLCAMHARLLIPHKRAIPLPPMASVLTHVRTPVCVYVRVRDLCLDVCVYVRVRDLCLDVCVYVRVRDLCLDELRPYV